jgi:hypothetical protein
MTQLEMMTSTDVVRQRNRLDVALQELDVLTPAFRLVLVGERQHVVRHVQAVGLARRADAPRRQQHVDAAARAEVEHHSPGFSSASAVGLPQPSEASTASAGSPSGAFVKPPGRTGQDP